MLNRTRTATQVDCLVVLGQHLAVSPKLFNAPDGHTLWMTISMVMFGCFLAFMISVSEFLLLSHTSSLTLSISGIFKVSSNSHCLSMFYARSLERHIPSLGAVWTPICHTSFIFHSELCLISIVLPTDPLWAWRGGRGTLCNDLYGEALPERGTFFRLQVHERVEILLVEVYNRVGKSVIWVFLRVQKGWQMNLMAFKSRGTFYFCDWSMIYSSWKECKVLNKVCERGTICQ